MRWPWRRSEDPPHEAQELLERVKRQQPDVDRMTAILRDYERRNHFSAWVAAAWRGGGSHAPRSG